MDTLMLQRATLTAPLRIDFCGGYTDIAEISKVTGTAIANLGIDLYRDLARTHPVAFAVHSGIPSHLGAQSKTEFAELSDSVSPLFRALHTYAQLHLGQSVDYSQLLTIKVAVPVSMGLGVSSALSVLLTSAVRLHQGWDLPTIRNHAFRDAQVFEKDILQVSGGYQDFIPAIYGGYNFITAEAGFTPKNQDNSIIMDPAAVTIATHAVPPPITAYLDSCVFIVYYLRPASSSKIIDDIITRSTDHSEQESKLLRVSQSIHYYNTLFHHQLCRATAHQCADSNPNSGGSPALPFSSDDRRHLVNSIERAWELRQQFSELASNPVLDQVAQAVMDDIYCCHGVGAGGSVLVLYSKPDRVDHLNSRLAALSQDLGITIFYPKVNHTGIQVTFRDRV